MNRYAGTGTLVVVALLTGLSSTPTGAAESSISSDQVEKRREVLFYKKGTEELFTGLVIEKYANGQTKAAVNIVDGRSDGSTTEWFPTGQKKRETKVDRSLKGHITEWYENGQMKSDQNTNGGGPDGLVTEWYENGQMKTQETFVNWHGQGETSWYESGQIRAEDTFSRRDGGTGTATAWYANGQMKSQEMFVNGRGQGETTWDESGTKSTLHAEAEEALQISGGSKAAVARDSKAIDVEQTERRQDGLIYKLGSDTPFSGLIREVYSRKKKKSEVHYVDGKPAGLTTRWWANGEMQFSGSFESGRPAGLRTDYYQDGQKKTEANYVDGKLTGLRTDYYQNGHKATESTLVDGVPNGISASWYENGNLQQEAMLVDGVPHGLVTTGYWNRLKKSEDNYVHGQEKQEGPSTKWNDKGQVEFQGSYQSGKFTGEVIRWTGNGQAFIEEKFVDGTQVEYAEDLGSEHANGQLRAEQRWINGKRQETLWYENGQRERVSTVGDDTEDGQTTQWYENGQKEVEYRKVFGVTEGLVTYWYENGQKKLEGTVVHGKKEGVETEWFEDGRKKSEINYIAGRPEDLTATPADPPPFKASVVLEPGTDVVYGMHRGSVRFWNTAIQSVRDGRFSGNTAVVSPGATVQMTGNWEIGPVTDPGKCPGCNVQIYIAWVPDAADRGAWPPNQGLWKGMANSVKPNSEPSGSFDWTSQAPTAPGVYYVGRGQTLDFAFKRLTQGEPGAPTAGPDTVKAASFRIEVRAEAAN